MLSLTVCVSVCVLSLTVCVCVCSLQNGEASLFEVNIRYVGGLLSAFYLTGEEVRVTPGHLTATSPASIMTQPSSCWRHAGDVCVCVHLGPCLRACLSPRVLMHPLMQCDVLRIQLDTLHTHLLKIHFRLGPKIY